MKGTNMKTAPCPLSYRLAESFVQYIFQNLFDLRRNVDYLYSSINLDCPILIINSMQLQIKFFSIRT